MSATLPNAMHTNFLYIFPVDPCINSEFGGVALPWIITVPETKTCFELLMHHNFLVTKWNYTKFSDGEYK
jgi:hypothetical protein